MHPPPMTYFSNRSQQMGVITPSIASPPNRRLPCLTGCLLAHAGVPRRAEAVGFMEIAGILYILGGYPGGGSICRARFRNYLKTKIRRSLGGGATLGDESPKPPIQLSQDGMMAAPSFEIVS